MNIGPFGVEISKGLPSALKATAMGKPGAMQPKTLQVNERVKAHQLGTIAGAHFSRGSTSNGARVADAGRAMRDQSRSGAHGITGPAKINTSSPFKRVQANRQSKWNADQAKQLSNWRKNA